MNDVLNKHRNRPSETVTTFPKRDVIVVLPYLGFQSEVVKRRLKSCVNKFYGFVNLRLIFQNTCRVKSFFPNKDRLNRSQKSKVVYRPICWDCELSVSAKQSDDCMTERWNILKPLRNWVTPPLLLIRDADHAISTGHNIKWDHFEVLAIGRCVLHCKIKETLFIRDLKPTLNDNVGSEKLWLYL